MHRCKYRSAFMLGGDTPSPYWYPSPSRWIGEGSPLPKLGSLLRSSFILTPTDLVVLGFCLCFRFCFLIVVCCLFFVVYFLLIGSFLFFVFWFFVFCFGVFLFFCFLFFIYYLFLLLATRDRVSSSYRQGERDGGTERDERKAKKGTERGRE